MFVESLSSGKPIPAVEASDMKRVWELTSETTRHKAATPGSVAININLVVSQCSEDADPLAVFFRVALLRPLVEGGLLDNWRDGDRPHDVVFQTLARFPLPNGIQNFRPDEFARALRNAV
jgi:hypothetical protein